MDYSTHSTTGPYLAKVRSHVAPYHAEVLGKRIIIFPQVMSPKYDWSTEFFIRSLPDLTGKNFLEVGCGSGAVSLFAKLKGATAVTAVDINKAAIENTKENLRTYQVGSSQVFYSDVFENVAQKFHVIAFNAPYHGSKPKDMLEYGVSDPDYRALRKFLRDAPTHLLPGGKILLGFSNTGDVQLVQKLIHSSRLLCLRREEETRDGWTALYFELKPVAITNAWQQFVYDDDAFWAEKYAKYVVGKRVAKIGYGFGYAANMLMLAGAEVQSFDVQIVTGSVMPEQVKVYDGLRLPCKDDTFDVAICTYTLHHAKASMLLFAELIRIAPQVIIIAETYQNFFQKIDVVYNCWQTNRRARQGSGVRWGSYFAAKDLQKAFAENRLEVLEHQELARRSFNVELYVAERRNTR